MLSSSLATHWVFLLRIGFTLKLIRFGAPGSENPGLILPDGTRVDASGFGADYDEAFFASDGLAQLERLV